MKKKNATRADGRIQAQVYLGVVDGKPKYKYVYGATQKEVDKKVQELKIKLGKGIDLSAERDTFGAWGERWLKYKKTSVSCNRYVSYDIRYKNLESLWSCPIAKIRTSDIQDIIVDYATKPSQTTGKPYAKKTLIEIRQVASQVFQLAVENRIIDYNPATAVKIPAKAAEETKRALTDEEQDWIVNTPHRAQTAAMIMMYAGLRRGELIPLLWSDVNLVDKTISVNKSVEIIKSQSVVKTTCKTSSSIRTVYIPQVLVDFLTEQKRTSLLVCPSAKGVLMSEQAWRTMWDSYLSELNIKYGKFENSINAKKPTSVHQPIKIPLIIPHITAHWLRHTFITLMYFAGVDILTAKEQAGHADIKTTMSIYTHLDSKFKKISMQKLDNYIDACHMPVKEIEKN